MEQREKDEIERQNTAYALLEESLNNERHEIIKVFFLIFIYF